MDAVPLNAVIRTSASLVLIAIMTPASVAAHETRLFDVPAGTLSTSLVSLSRQGNISVAVADADLWQLSVKPVRGKMPAERALALLLQGSGARAVQVSQTSWRIEFLPAPLRPRSRQHLPHGSEKSATIASGHLSASEDIIVTASKADLPASHFAGSAVLISGSDLNFGGESGTGSLLRQSATLSSTHLGSGRNKLFIRGIADSSFTGPTQSTVGQYFGDIRISYNAPDPDLRLYDLDGVEVIEGPQGTLYGAGSLGGIVRMIPRAPNPDAAELQTIAGITLTKNGQPGGDMAAIANIPVSQNKNGGGSALRILGYLVLEGGYIDNPYLGRSDINQTQVRGTRATLRIAPDDRLTIDIGGIYQEISAADAQYVDRRGDGLSRRSAVVEGVDARYAMTSLVVTQDLGDLRVQSSNAYIHHKLSESFDASRAIDLPEVIDQDSSTEMWVSETHLSRPFNNGYGWVLGFSYINNSSVQSRVNASFGSRRPLTGVRNRISEYTVFGHGTVAITPRLIATAGLRLSNSTLNGEAEGLLPLMALDPQYRGITASSKERDILPSASLLYTVSDHLRVYASYSEGFRPGGLTISNAFVSRYRSDRIKTWEGGVRFGVHPSAPINASLVLSHSKWTDIQADFIDDSGFPTTANVGNGRITSLSALLAMRINPELTVELGGVYNRSRVTEAQFLADITHASIPERLSFIPNVARYTLHGSATYAVPLGRDDLRINGWAQYVGPSRLGIGPILGESQGEYLDSGVAMRLGNAVRGFSVTLNNPFDVRGNRFALGTPFRTGENLFITPLRPRSLRFAVDFSY